ncbi:MAG: carboxypeptidase-like regulatory domain-containing protein, partial [bacterium]
MAKMRPTSQAFVTSLVPSQLSLQVSLLVLSCLVVACLTGCSIAPPPGSPETGYTITGYVGKSSALPAINENVLLLDAETGKPVDTATTNWMGKYTFSGVMPGFYTVTAGSVERKVLVKDQSQRLDIDLSAKDGVMDYSKTASLTSGKSGGKAGSKGA